MGIGLLFPGFNLGELFAADGHFSYILLFLLVIMVVVYVVWLRISLAERDKRLKLLRNYSSLVENMPMMYAREKLIYDKEGNIIDFIFDEVNPTFEKYVLPKEKIVGKRYSELNPKNFGQLMECYKVLNEEKNFIYQYYHKKSEMYFTVTVMLSKEEGYVDIFCADHTELSDMQHMLRSTNHKLAVAVDVAEITPWKWVLDDNEFICDADRYLYVMKNEVIVRNGLLTIPMSSYFDKIHKDDLEMVRQEYQKLIDGETTKVKAEYRIGPDKDNPDSYEWVEVCATVDERADDGRPKILVGTSMVITQRKKMEEALITAKQKAEQASKIKSAFLANMSHEIRTPLNAIVGFSQLLLSSSKASEEEKLDYMRIIEINNDLLLQLVGDVLDFSNLETGTLELMYDNVNIDDLFRKLQETTSLRNKKTNVEIRYNCEMPDCFMFTDKVRLSQVVGNLINNALKFTSEGTVEFGFRQQGDLLIYFYVQDTGCGISAEHIGSIFDRFMKVNNFVPGTGLGLPICQTLIHKMGGEIGVESQEGVGSKFWFTLPRRLEMEK